MIYVPFVMLLVTLLLAGKALCRAAEHKVVVQGG